MGPEIFVLGVVALFATALLAGHVIHAIKN
jgi:hypothetical protein